MKRRINLALLGLAAASAFTAHLPAMAQANFPEKTIRIIVPYPPGGATDVSARLLAGEMTRQIGQSVAIRN